MPKLDDVAYYYHGDEGEYLLGVPARDLTHLDMESLDLLQRRDVMHATVPRGDDKVMPLYSTSKAKPKAIEPDPVEPVSPPDAPPPAEGEKG